MSVYSLVSSLLSYVFTTIIYLFIFSVIALIYMDIKKMNKNENVVETDNDICDDEMIEKEEKTAVLRTIKTDKAAESGMKTFYRIGEEPIVIGRGKMCDIVIENMFLSVEHCQIWCEDDVWYIGDMGSKNGTYLNDVELTRVMTLNDGDEISFGGVAMTFEEE